MSWFAKKKDNQKVRSEPAAPVAASDAVRAEMGLPLDSDAPWIRAQLHHDDRFLRMAAHARNWQRQAVMAYAAMLFAVAGIAFIAVQWRVTPVFIEVDKLGRMQPMVTGVADGARVDARRLIYREMVDFITNVRTVTSDYAANNKALSAGFSRLTGAAHNYVKNDLLSHKPNEVAEKKTIVVEVKLAIPITDGSQRNSWQVEWTETSYNLAGEVMGPPELWKANIQYERDLGKRSEEDVNANPLGLFIPTLSWGKHGG